MFSNRILLEDPSDPFNSFHMRIDMFKTSSYSELEDGWKGSLYNLYVDYFYRRQNNMWRERAMQKLPMMQNTTNMLVCGEDLGMIPDCVQGVLDELSVLGLRIQRMPKDPKEEIENPLNYPYLCVCSPSVHDTSTLRGWWEEDRHGAKLLANMVGLEGTLPIYCEPYIVEKILSLHFSSPAMLVVVAIQDFFSLDSDLRGLVSNPEDERVNVPANRFHYWRYRIPVTLENLLSNNDWSDKISNLIKNSGR